MTKKRRPTYVICLDNGRGYYDVDLVIGKIYRVARAEKGDSPTELRILDESGEDYLYPAKWFVAVDLPAKARRALMAAVS